MSQFSKDELPFVNKLPEHVQLECPVCLNILANPHLVSCCGHNFCESCIERVKASNGACPMCKEMSFQAMVNKGHLRIINGLQVYCTNKENSCEWKGELKNLSRHLNKGKREGECRYEEVKCRHGKCEERKQRQNLDHHEAKECLQQPFKCQYCSTTGTYCSITKEHYRKFLQYPVLCPNQCTLTQMPRGSVTDHVDSECPLQPVDCVFSWAGCKERPLRKDIELHTTDTKHMMILAVACGELKKEIKGLKDENIKLKQELIWATSHHLLPIEITHQFTFYSYESKVIHFYTSQQGYHMSAKIVRTVHELCATTYTLLLALHEGMFDKCKPKLPKIFAKYKGRIIPLIEDTEATYEFIHGETLNEVTSIYNIPSGVLTKELWTVYDNTIVVNVRIYT